MTGVGLGWLQGTLRGRSCGAVVELLSDVLGAKPEARAGGTRWYSEAMNVGPHGLVAWAPRSRPEAAETYIEVQQTGLDELGAEASMRLVGDLQRAGARFSRVDAYFDDHARHVEPHGVAEAFRGRLAVSHIRRVRELRGWVLSDGPEDARHDGATTYLGSPASEAMIRVYDKAAESGRSDAGVRWEVQMRRKRADLFAAGLAAAGEGLGAYVVGCIRGLIDFRERSGIVHGERAALIDWWAAIVRDAERIGLNSPVRVDSLEKRANWLARQAAPTLALVWMAYGSDWLNALLVDGEERLSEAQLQLLGGRRPPGGAA